MLFEGQDRGLGLGGAENEGDKKLNLLGLQPTYSKQATEENGNFQYMD